MTGDATLLARQDCLKEAWRGEDSDFKAVTPVFEHEWVIWGLMVAEQITPPGGAQNPSAAAPGVK